MLNQEQLNQQFENIVNNRNSIFALIETQDAVIEESDFHNYCVAMLDDFEAYETLWRLQQAKSAPAEWRWALTCEDVKVPSDWRQRQRRIEALGANVEYNSGTEYLVLLCPFQSGFKVWCVLRAMKLLVAFNLEPSGYEKPNPNWISQSQTAEQEKTMKIWEAQWHKERDEFFARAASQIPHAKIAWESNAKKVLQVKIGFTTHEVQYGDIESLELIIKQARKPVKKR